MKKLILISILVGLLATPVLAGSTFRFTTQAEVLGFTELTGTMSDTVTLYTDDGDATAVTTFNDGTYGGSVTYTQTYQVGLVADAVGEEQGTRKYIGIGGTFDLSSGYDAFAMTIANDNDDTWDYRLFADDGTTTVLGSWTTVSNWGTTANLSVPLPGGFGTNTTKTKLGLMVGYGTNENQIHTSVVISDCQLEVTKEACVLVPGGDDCKGKVISMELEYTGDGCAGSEHCQDPKKVKCSGDVDGAALVDIVVPGKAAKAKKGQPAPAPIYWGEAYGLSIGESVFVDAAYGGKTIIDNDTLVIITDPDTGNVEEVKFHTSCSQPLSVGDQFGSMKVISMTTTEGGTGGSDTCIKEIPATGADVEYTYTITNTGAVEITDVNVIDNVYGEVPGSPIDSILPGNSVVLKLTEFLSDETTNTVVVTAAEGCRAEDYATITKAPPKCTTKVQKMLLRYIGVDIDDARVELIADKFKKTPVVYPNIDLIQDITEPNLPGENGWTIDATVHSTKNELGSKVTILINGVKEVIHTSCSTPFIAGEPAPLDKPKGDPSPNWLVVDFVQK